MGLALLKSNEEGNEVNWNSRALKNSISDKSQVHILWLLLYRWRRLTRKVKADCFSWETAWCSGESPTRSVQLKPTAGASLAGRWWRGCLAMQERQGFHPCWGSIPHAGEQLSLCAAATEVRTPEPCPATRDAAAPGAQLRPRAVPTPATRQSLCAATETQGSQK